MSDATSIGISVAICTWNRSAFLRDTLEEFCAVSVPAGLKWELIVVNNVCTDDTDEVVAEFFDRLPIRLVHEDRPGLANARNQAIEQARGTYILWTDDDVLVSVGWIEGYLTAFQRWPDASFFGGPIVPLFEGNSPEWLPAVLAKVPAAYGAQDLGPAPVPVTSHVLPFGPYGGNMAMRIADQRRFLYDPRLGVRHDHYTTGEEIDVMGRMLGSGLQGWWTPEPSVRHRIPEENQTLAYARRWLIGCGTWEGRRLPKSGPTLLGRPPRLWAEWIWREFRYRSLRIFGSPKHWAQDMVAAGILRGQLSGYALRD